MKRTLLVVTLAACVENHAASVTFGSEGEGLDGFLCKESGAYLLNRVAPQDGGMGMLSIVTDIVGIENGQPGCRTGQLVNHCSKHKCAPTTARRSCTAVPITREGTGDREKTRAALLDNLGMGLTAAAPPFITNAPDEFVLVRLVGTTQPCAEIAPTTGEVPEFDRTRLVGCSYSCPVLLDRADEVYLGFDGFVGQCEQGVSICASGTLTWMP